MAIPTVAFGAGAFSAKLFVQPGNVGAAVPLTVAQMGSQDLQNAAAATTNVTAIVIPANQLIVEEVGTFGYESAEAAFPIAGSRYGSKVAVQSGPSTLSLTYPFNPASETFQLMTELANSGTDVRTYIISWLVGANTLYYAFNAFVGAIGYNFATNAEAKATSSIIPQGAGQFGYSFSA